MKNDTTNKATLEEYGVTTSELPKAKPTLNLNELTTIILTQDDGDPAFISYDEIVKRA